jgi:hypothetical protein
MSLYPENPEQWRYYTINACRFIPPHLLAAERDLMTKKWFGYRFATPWQATQHFADLYREGFKNYTGIIVTGKRPRPARVCLLGSSVTPVGH